MFLNKFDYNRCRTLVVYRDNPRLPPRPRALRVSTQAPATMPLLGPSKSASARLLRSIPIFTADHRIQGHGHLALSHPDPLAPHDPEASRSRGEHISLRYPHNPHIRRPWARPPTRRTRSGHHPEGARLRTAPSPLDEQAREHAAKTILVVSLHI